MTGVLVRRRHLNTDTDVHRRKMTGRQAQRPCEDSCKGWSWTILGPGMLTTEGHRQKLQKGKKAFFPAGSQGCTDLLTPWFGLLASRTAIGYISGTLHHQLWVPCPNSPGTLIRRGELLDMRQKRRKLRNKVV